MNLIFERWIPICRKDGSRERIAPWELTDQLESNLIMTVASPRPDFDGALTQFLIGLLQTTCTPDAYTWRLWRKQPPAPEELKTRFASVAHAFQLEGKFAFMQDFDAAALDKSFPISALLIGSPPEDSETDLFIKQKTVNQICSHCAAIALFALQTDSPEGGRGYRTGLRGGGPLTTLVLGQHIWETCWLNVLEANRYYDHPLTEAVSDARRFPWCGATRTSEGKPPAGLTTPVDVHPDQQFWSLPRRIRLLAEDAASVACDLCGQTHERMYRRFQTKNYGVNYDGFQHPLSPYYSKEQAWFAMHPQPGGMGYRHWLGLAANAPNGSKKIARVVEQYRSLPNAPEAEIWAFGYDMKSNKARCWYDAKMPLLTVAEKIDIDFRDSVARLIEAAEKAADYLHNHLKEALLGNKATVRGDLRFIKAEFWASTETAFYEHLRQLWKTLPTDSLAQSVLESWWQTLRGTAFVVFERHSQTGDFDAVNPKKIAHAFNGLRKCLNGPLLKEKILGLPKSEKKTPKNS